MALRPGQQPRLFRRCRRMLRGSRAILAGSRLGRMGGNEWSALRASVAALAASALALCLRQRTACWLFSRALASDDCILGRLRCALSARTPAALALFRRRVSLGIAFGWGIRAGIDTMKLRRNISVTGFAVTPALATTGALGTPFFHCRCPWFRRLWAVSGVNHCLIHSAARKLQAMLLASIKVTLR